MNKFANPVTLPLIDYSPQHFLLAVVDGIIRQSGGFIEVDRVLPGEGRLRLHFYLPGDPKPLQLESDVLRAEFTGGTAKYGVRFIAADDAERERIERFVRRLRSRELL